MLPIRYAMPDLHLAFSMYNIAMSDYRKVFYSSIIRMRERNFKKKESRVKLHLHIFKNDALFIFKYILYTRHFFLSQFSWFLLKASLNSCGKLAKRQRHLS